MATPDDYGHYKSVRGSPSFRRVDQLDEYDDFDNTSITAQIGQCSSDVDPDVEQTPPRSPMSEKNDLTEDDIEGVGDGEDGDHSLCNKMCRNPKNFNKSPFEWSMSEDCQME